MKNTPTLTWSNVSKSTSDSSFALTAPTSTAPGTFTYTSATPGVISLNGDVASINGVGTSVITASFTPTDTNNYGTTTKTMTITVGATAQTITRTSTSPTAPLRYQTYTPTATASSSLSVAISIAPGSSSVCSIASGVVTFNSVGNCVVQYNQSGNAIYSAATQVTETLAIGQETPTFAWITGTSKTYGTSSFDLPAPESSTPGSWTYSSGSSSVASISGSTVTIVGYGTSIITATFTPTDATNYVTGGTVTLNLFVAKAALAVTASSHTVRYGGAIPSITPIYSGFVNGDSSTVVSGTSCSTTYTTTAAIGSASSSCTGAIASNYSVTYTAGVITVNPKALTISGLTGVNKEFDRGLSGSVTGMPTLVGKVGSDDVLLAGTPVFTFASANIANGITVTASGYTLTGSAAGNYTLTQPTVTANITQKAARVAANNVTVAFGAPITSGVTASGLISPDAVGSASYTYTGTGTSTPPTAVGIYTVTPSNAVFSTGQIANYSITYDTATVTILAKYTITFNANGGSVSNGSTATIDFVVGDSALTLPTPTRPNYTFTGWYTLQTNGVQVTGAYTPTATATLWARWIQNSLFGMGANTNIFTLTISNGGGWDIAPSAGGGTVGVNIPAGALVDGTVVSGYLLSDTTTATSVIGSGNDYVMSLVLAWVHPTTELVENTASGKPITMTITNSVIKKGAKIYSVVGSTSTVLATAIVDGSAVILITEDPQIVIAITKPDAPTGVSATSGGNASTTVSWTAPSDGGSVITGYTVTSNAGQTCTSTTTSCSISGLTNGTPYTFTVTATNSIGVSDPSSASSPITPAVPVVTPPSSGGGGGGSTYVAPTPTVDPAVAAAAAAKALADAKAAEEKAAADAKALAEKRAAEEAELLAQIKALQEKADAESLAAAKKLQEELAATLLKAEEELKAAAALKVAEEQRAAAAKRVTTVYSTTAAFKLNTTYSKRLTTYSKKIAAGSTVTCIGYAKSSKTLSYAKAKTVATKQAKALCTSMKKINPTLVTKSTVLPASKAPVTTVNKKWIPVSYRVQAPVN